jgi:hypothetical protein
MTRLAGERYQYRHSANVGLFFHCQINKFERVEESEEGQPQLG